MEEIIYNVACVFGGIALFGIIITYFLVRTLRKHRVLYRLNYIFLSLCGWGIPVALIVERDSLETAMVVTMCILTIPLFLGALIVNVRGLIIETKDKPVISTLENCTVDIWRSNDRTYMWVEGTSREGRKDRFKIEYLTEQAIVEQKEVTPETVFVFEYYERTNSMMSMKREN